MGWLVSPQLLVGFVLLVVGVVGGLLADLPPVVVVLIAFAFFVLGLVATHYALALWDRLRRTPTLVVHDPETHFAALAQNGAAFAAVKVPFANDKSRAGKGLKMTGLHAEFRVFDSSRELAVDWTQARWDEVPQQHERPPGASSTAPGIRTINLDPNGLKHYMETVVQIQNEPPVLFPWTQDGPPHFGIPSPVTIEVRWEGNEVNPGSRTMKVVASEPPSLDPHGEWIDFDAS